MESTLQELITSSQRTLKLLRGPLAEELRTTLSDAKKLPAKSIYNLTLEAENVLDQISLLIRPSSDILAENFLGMHNRSIFGMINVTKSF